MVLLKSTSGRALLGFVFLVGVNALAGVIAVELDYPSLWGRSSSVFPEYAYPVPYGWALAHWISMAPLTLLIVGMPMWTKPMIIRARWILFACLVICLFIEVDLGRGSLRHIPFMLFLIVDLTTALLFAHLFFPRVKVLVGVALGLAVIIASLTIGPGLNLYLQEAWSPKPASTADEPLLVSADVVTQEYQKLVEFHLQVSPTVAPGKYPTDSQICAEAERVLSEMLVAHPLTDGFHSIVYFWSHPWFETDRHLWYPSGNASTNNQGVWECEFVYPDEADS